MSSQQIPSVAQIAAARFALWHQNTPELAAGSPAESTADAPDALLTPGSPEISSETPSPEMHADLSAVDKGPEAAPADGSESTPVAEPHPESPAVTRAVPAPVPSSAAILTQSAAREFLNRAGLLLFAARPQFSGVPAPTFIEATLGTANANPSLSATETARTLLAYLVADGSAVPLNLLGLPATTAESPDFVVSAAAFPYIFTLRGDKAWKQAPATSGTMKVSPLAANTYALLVENGPKSAYALTADLGKEVTEAAVLRALSELWQQLRVLPVPQPKGKPTVWEPITTRFTKQIKTGANAGQPTALSTFVSLFLGQSILATEDEIETFLSPLAPRSRVRDVLHALSGARQLETVTVEGKHHLHIAGDLPLFASPQPEASAEVPILAEDGSRIKKFVPKPRKLGTGSTDRPKPFRSPADRDRSSARPPGKRLGSAPAGRSFNKPWEEEKQARADRAAAADAPEFQDIDLDAAGTPAPERPAQSASKPAFGRKPFTRGLGSNDKPAVRGRSGFSDRPRFGGGDRPALNRDRPAGNRPAFNRDRPAGDRPAAAREGGDRFQPRDARRDFTPRREDGDFRPARKPFGREPAFGGKSAFPRKPFNPDAAAPSDRERRPFRRDNAAGQDSRPPRRTFDSGPDRAPADRGNFSGKPRFSRDRDSDSGGRPPFRKFDAPRTPRPPREGSENARPSRPAFTGDRSSSRGPSYAPKPSGNRPFPRRDTGDAPSRGSGFAPREGSAAPRREGGFPPRREGGFAPRREDGFAEKRGAGSAPRRDGGAGDRKSFAPRTAPGGTGKPFVKKSFSRSAPDAPGASTFDKFKGGNKPWGKRPPARKYKPKGDEA